MAVRVVALRSLAAVVVLMRDRDKLPQLVETLDRTLRVTQKSSSTPVPQSIVEVSCNWLLPTVAEWCLETETFKQLMFDPWIERLQCLCLVGFIYQNQSLL